MGGMWYKVLMEFPSKLIAFRCPAELIGKIDQIAKAMNTTRTGVVLEAVRLLSRQVHARGGRVIPPYEGISLLYTMHFEPDGRGMGARKKPLVLHEADEEPSDFGEA